MNKRDEMRERLVNGQIDYFIDGSYRDDLYSILDHEIELTEKCKRLEEEIDYRIKMYKILESERESQFNRLQALQKSIDECDGLPEKRTEHCDGCPYLKEHYCDCGMFDFNDAIDLCRLAMVKKEQRIAELEREKQAVLVQHDMWKKCTEELQAKIAELEGKLDRDRLDKVINDYYLDEYHSKSRAGHKMKHSSLVNAILAD